MLYCFFALNPIQPRLLLFLQNETNMKYEILEKSNSVTEYFISSYHENFITYSPSFIIGDYFYSFFIL